MLTVLIFIYAICACNSTRNYRVVNEIIELGDSKVCGDKGGRFQYTQIRKDSTIKITGSRWNPKLNDTIKIRTSQADWKKLTRIISVSDFEKLIPGYNGNLMSDGCIKRVYLKTTDSTYAKGGLNLMDNLDSAKKIEELIH